MGYVLVLFFLAMLARHLHRSAIARGEAGQARRSAALYVAHVLVLAFIAVSPWYTGRVVSDVAVGTIEAISVQSPDLAKATTADVAELRANGHGAVADWADAFGEGDREYVLGGLDDLYDDLGGFNRAVVWAFSGDRIQNGYRTVMNSRDYRLLPLLMAEVSAKRQCEGDDDWSRFIDNMSGPDSYVDPAVSDAALKAIEDDCQGVMDSIDRDRLRDAAYGEMPSMTSVFANAFLLQYSPGEMSR